MLCTGGNTNFVQLYQFFSTFSREIVYFLWHVLLFCEQLKTYCLFQQSVMCPIPLTWTNLALIPCISVSTPQLSLLPSTVCHLWLIRTSLQCLVVVCLFVHLFGPRVLARRFFSCLEYIHWIVFIPLIRYFPAFKSLSSSVQVNSLINFLNLTKFALLKSEKLITHLFLLVFLFNVNRNSC